MSRVRETEANPPCYDVEDPEDRRVDGKLEVIEDGERVLDGLDDGDLDGDGELEGREDRGGALDGSEGGDGILDGLEDD